MKQNKNLTLHPGSPSGLFYTTLHINVEMRLPVLSTNNEHFNNKLWTLLRLIHNMLFETC